MADAHHHAVSSAKKWGGSAGDYVHIHQWFDESKHHYAGPAHRALRHHTQGIAEAIERFGDDTGVFQISTGRDIPVRWVAEQHVIEDFGFIPSYGDFVQHIAVQPWMVRGARQLSKEL